MNVSVLGATGQNGRTVVRELLAVPDKFVGFVHNTFRCLKTLTNCCK